MDKDEWKNNGSGYPGWYPVHWSHYSISRQGAHKCAKGLIERGYIIIENQNVNSRDKILFLTEKGLRFCRETLILKEKFETDIINAIGEDKFQILKQCLSENWFQK